MSTVDNFLKSLRGHGPVVVHAHRQVGARSVPVSVCVAETTPEVRRFVDENASRGCTQFFVTTNTLKEEWLIKRERNKTLPATGNTPRDTDIERIDWVFIDFDPLRESGICATDEEKAAALEVQQRVLADLRARGIEPEIRTDSGNGYGLFIRAIDGMTGEQVKAFVSDLGARFSNDQVKVDTSVTNPSRITRLIGMPNRKGANTPARPHRLTDFTVEATALPLRLDQLPSLPEPPSTTKPAKTVARVPVKDHTRLHLTSENVVDALNCLNPSMSRGTWLPIIGGVKNHLGEAGYEVARAWSSRSTTNYPGDNGFRLEWDNIEETNGRGGETATIGTVMYHAIAAGYKPPMPEIIPASQADLREIAKSIINEDFDNLIVMHQGDAYRFNGSCYVAMSYEEFEARLLNAMSERLTKITANHVTSCIKHFRSLTRVSELNTWREGFDHPDWDLSKCHVCLNGIVNTDRFDEYHNSMFGKPSSEWFIPSTPAAFVVGCTDYNFDANAIATPEWLKFLARTFGGEQAQIDTLQEFLGYCLLYDLPIQKALMLCGEPRSGKGTFLRSTEYMVGRRNAIGMSLSDLGSRFGRSHLPGKKVGTIGDVEHDAKSSPAIVECIKQMTGGDTMQVDRKGRDPLVTKLPCKLIIACNTPLNLRDPSGALANRFIYLQTRGTVRGHEDPGLDAKLQAEASGILMWSMVGLKRLLKRGRFIQPAEAMELVEDVANIAAPLQEFVDAYCRLDAKSEASTRDVYESYRAWCYEQGMQPDSESRFGLNLRTTCPKIKRVRRMKGGQRTYVYTGIELVSVFVS